MTTDTLITIVFILIALIILAFMASQLDIDISAQKDSWLPNIKIKFSKDSSLFGFLKGNQTRNDEIETSDEPYINKYVHGKVSIQYGDSAITNGEQEVTIQAQQDGCDKYYYYIADSESTFKRESGFLENDNEFKKIRDFDSWDATIEAGIFSNLNRITLPIKKLKIGQQLKLKYALELFIHYREVLNPNTDITYHHFFFRLLNTTENAIFEFEIPVGIESKCIRFDFIVEYNNQSKFNYTANINEGIIQLPKDYGNVWIRKDKKKIYVQWTTNKRIPQGSIYKLKWFTEKL